MHRVVREGVLAGAGLIALWWIVIVLFNPPPYLLPTPGRVLEVVITKHTLLAHHALATLGIIVAALLLSASIGLIVGGLLYYSTSVRRVVLAPLLVLQVMPLFALAPLLVLWLGYGASSKIACAVLITCFPLILGTWEGLRRVPQPYVDFAASVNTPFWPLWGRVLLPAALPVLTPALKMAAIFAPLAAVLGEWVGSSQGLGYLMLQANGRLHTDVLFAALGCLSLVSLGLYAAVSLSLQALQRHTPDARLL
ncbi:MAG: ABC transporter permease [Holosporales bacterium]|jgi:putative hydroxymethylpyrimidine transport system permease protein